MNPKFETILFDADNTLFDNGNIHELVTEKILQEMGLDPIEAKKIHQSWDEFYFQEQKKAMEEQGFCIDRENASRSLVMALQKHQKTISLEEADGFWKFMVEFYAKYSKPFPEVPSLLHFLKEKGVKTAIVSNGDLTSIKKRLKNNDLEEFFEFVVAPCKELPYTKPDKKIFEFSLKKIKSSPEKTIFVGDNPHSDIKGANGSGLFTVLVDREEKITELKGRQRPDLKIRKLTEIKKLFEQTGKIQTG